MTLSDVHSDPRLLADLLGVPFEDGTVTQHGYRYGGWGRVETPIPAADRVARAFAEYRRRLHEEFSKSAGNPYKAQTRDQFIAECLREGLGIRRAGRTADKVEYARMARPDLYAAAA